MQQKAEQEIHFNVHLLIVRLLMLVLVKDLDAVDGKFAKYIKNSFKSRNLLRFISTFLCAKIKRIPFFTKTIFA